jgi:hypothetical protein
VLLAAALLLVWLLADPRTPDLAAQAYRLGSYERNGFAVYDLHWYAGHALPGYSLLFAPLASLVGIRALSAVVVLASSALFERIVLAIYGRARCVRLGACLFAVAAVGDVWSGRVTFALGVTFALACTYALLRGRRAIGALLAAICAAASPVAGVLLVLAALTYALVRRAPRVLIALAAPVVVVLAPVRLLFPEGGFEPYPLTSFLATVIVVGSFLLALPWARARGGRSTRSGGGGSSEDPSNRSLAHAVQEDPRVRMLRIGALVYLLACGLCLVVHTPMGSNVERYGVLLAGPLLLCSLALRPTPVSTSRLARVVVAVGAIAVWIVWGPVRETAAVAGSPATASSYYAPLERYLLSHGAGTERVEVPLTRSHWEAALLAPSVPLARGWEKQLEERYDHVLLGRGLTAASYYAWLREQAVSFVALPDVPLDSSSAREGELIRRGLPYLHLVFSSAHWRVYAVAGATPLVSGPGRLATLGADTFALDASASGTMLVRVHYTRYFTLTAGNGCVTSAPGGWTYVRARAPGQIVVAAKFSLARALGLSGSSCPVPAGAIDLSAAGPAREAVGTAASATGPDARVGPGYEWVGPIPSAALSIAAENRLPGTRAWRLPGPAQLISGAAHGPIAGYVAEQAIVAGQMQRVYVDAPGARTVSVEAYRMGWYRGLGGRLVLRSARLPLRSQPACTHVYETGLTECDWHPTLSFTIPQWLTSGVYIAKLTASDGAQSDCLFVVRSAHPSPLLVDIPTASYEAYNAWGGDSLYPGGSDLVGVTGANQGVEVSYDRPYDSQTGAGQFFIREVAIVRFLERYGYPVSYTTIESIDGDPAQTVGVRALMDVGHSEYWSERDEHAFAAARARGASLLFLSSDTMAWRVRFAPATPASSQAGEPDHVIVAYKEHVALDPDRADPTGLFPGGGASLIGSAYNGCITPRVQQPGPPVYRYYPWRPRPSLQPSWLFAGTGVDASTEIPGIVGYELDERTSEAPPGTRTIGGGTVPCQSEDEPSPIRGSVADTTLYTARSGALVFATGTLGWLYALSPVPQVSPDAPLRPDRRVVTMTRNLLARALR